MKIVLKIKNKKQKRQMEDQMEFLIILNQVIVYALMETIKGRITKINAKA